jgi:hypothetical protein
MIRATVSINPMPQFGMTSVLLSKSICMVSERYYIQQDCYDTRYHSELRTETHTVSG